MKLQCQFKTKQKWQDKIALPYYFAALIITLHLQKQANPL
jgi:hypothetical protein